MLYRIWAHYEAVGDVDMDWEDSFKKLVVDGREKAIEIGNQWFKEGHGMHITLDIKSVPDDYKIRSSWRIEDEIEPDYTLILEVAEWDSEAGKQKVETVYVKDDEFYPQNGKIFHMSPKTIFKKYLGKEKAEQYFKKGLLLVATIYASIEEGDMIELDSFAANGDDKPRKYVMGYRKEFIG